MKFWKSLSAILMLLGVLVAPISFILPVTAQEGQVTLNPTDDAYTDGNNVNTNYGSAPTLKASSMFYRTWLKFDLSTIPEDAFGITAILELYTYYGGVIEPSEVVADLVLTDFNNFWSEDTITQDNTPHDASAYAELGSDFVGNDETWYEWLVTEAVVNATSNNATVVTIVMRHPIGWEILPTIFTSKEDSLTKGPKLTVSWEGIIPEFPAFLILPLFMATTLLAVIIIRRKRRANLRIPV